MKTYWFDPGADRYIGIVLEDVANALTNGTVPGWHYAVVYEIDDDEDPLWESGGGQRNFDPGRKECDISNEQ